MITKDGGDSPFVAALREPTMEGITPAYASPEVRSLKFFQSKFFTKMLSRRKQVYETDKAIDVFSFGMTLFEIITKTPPWGGKSPRQIQDVVSAGTKNSSLFI